MGSAVGYLTTATIGEKGQLTVPKDYRDELGLTAGSPVAVLRIGDGLILIPQHRRFLRLCESIAAALQGADLQGTLAGARQRVFRRRYPRLASRLLSKRP
jgi:AbrB family looped-hinge helix DNA binding protein